MFRHGWIEGTAIVVAVLVVATVTAGNDYSKEQQFRTLNAAAESDKKVKTVRNGAQLLLAVSDLLVGDVLILETGDKIPADGVLLQADGTNYFTNDLCLVSSCLSIR
jgi:P-type E1-E2 ATPase